MQHSHAVCYITLYEKTTEHTMFFLFFLFYFAFVPPNVLLLCVCANFTFYGNVALQTTQKS